jgi:MFS family permease
MHPCGKMKKYLTEKNLAIFLVIITSIIALIPHTVLYLDNNPNLISPEPYYHARIMEQILESGIPSHDNLSYNNRPYLLNPYHLILAASSLIFPPLVASKLLPFILAVLSVILFNSLLKEFFNIKERFIAALIFIVSPVFIYTSTVSSPISAIVFLNLLGMYFFRKKLLFILSILIFIIVSLFGPFVTLLSVILLACYSLTKREHLKKFFILLTIVLLFSFAYYYLLYLKYGLPSKTVFIQKNIFQYYISDLGSTLGFGVFNLLLIAIGLILTWRQKRKFIFFYVALLILFLSSIYFDYVNVYLNLFFSALSAIAFTKLLNMKWELTFIRKMSIILIICGLLFSTVSYTKNLVSLAPDKGMVNSLYWLNNYSRKRGVVLSHYSYGFFIQYFSNKKPLLDNYPYYSGNVAELYNISGEIFYSRNLEKTRDLLRNHDISFIWIDEKMKQGLVWTKEKEGLLFLFRNNETFKKIYHDLGIEIWKVLQKRDIE